MNTTMLKRFVFGVCLVIFQTGFLSTVAQSANVVIEGEVSIETLIHNIRTILGTSQKGVEIQLHGSCSSSESEVIAVSPIRWKSASASQGLPSTIRSALKENKQISVADDHPGVIAIKDANVSQMLLETEIKSLNLTKLERYSPNAAITAVVAFAEVQSALQKLNMRMVSSVPGLQNVSAAGGPHLEEHIKKTTLNDFVTSVLAQFGGYVVYEDCVDERGQSKFDIQYYK